MSVGRGTVRCSVSLSDETEVAVRLVNGNAALVTLGSLFDPFAGEVWFDTLDQADRLIEAITHGRQLLAESQAHLARCEDTRRTVWPVGQ